MLDVVATFEKLSERSPPEFELIIIIDKIIIFDD